MTKLTYYIIILSLLLTLPSQAGEWGSGITSRAVMVGVGRVNQLDTYLSPMEYTGPQLSFLTRRARLTHWAQHRISFQSTCQGAFSLTDNPAGTASDWAGRLAYDAGWHYHWTPCRNLRLMAGGLVGTDIGFLYNDRNGNNPAQGRFSVDVSASAGAAYDFHIRRLPLQLGYQADLPLAGAMFSPQFGQSYYDISQGHWNKNIGFTDPFNALSLRQTLTLDLVFRRTTLRLGYLSDIRQSHLHGIKVHDVSRSFMLGFVRYFRNVSRAERKEVSE